MNTSTSVVSKLIFANIEHAPKETLPPPQCFGKTEIYYKSFPEYKPCFAQQQLEKVDNKPNRKTITLPDGKELSRLVSDNVDDGKYHVEFEGSHYFHVMHNDLSEYHSGNGVRYSSCNRELPEPADVVVLFDKFFAVYSNKQLLSKCLCEYCKRATEQRPNGVYILNSDYSSSFFSIKSFTDEITKLVFFKPLYSIVCGHDNGSINMEFFLSVYDKKHFAYPYPSREQDEIIYSVDGKDTRVVDILIFNHHSCSIKIRPWLHLAVLDDDEEENPSKIVKKLSQPAELVVKDDGGFVRFVEYGCDKKKDDGGFLCKEISASAQHTMLSAHKNGNVIMWDMETCKPLQRVHFEFEPTALFLYDDNHFVCKGREKYIVVSKQDLSRVSCIYSHCPVC